MRGTRVAPRYAKSLLVLALEQKVADKVFEDMKVIAETVKSNRDFLVFLRSPVVKADKKMSVIKAVFHGRMSPMAEGFIRIITSHRRENILGEIAQSYVNQYKENKNIEVAEVTSAVKLDASALKKIQEKLKAREGREIEIVQKIDPDLIGGMIIRIGDRQFDGSISRQLKLLRKEFSQNAYVSQL
jgi:F-type H+-transporting ATPase subunit delta